MEILIYYIIIEYEYLDIYHVTTHISRDHTHTCHVITHTSRDHQ